MRSSSVRRQMSKKIFSLTVSVLLMFGIFTCAGCDSLDYEEDENFSFNDYKEVEARELVKSVEVNPAATAKMTEGQSLKIVGGRVDNIDSSGTQFSLNCGEFFVNSIVCMVEEDSPAQEQLLRLSHGQPVIIYGVVERVENITNMSEIFSAPSHVGDWYGFIISVVRIDTPKTTSTNTRAVRNPEI